MERATLNVEKRTKAGKGVARSLRREGMIPAVIYRAGDSIPITLSKKAIAEFIKATAGENTLVDLKFSDGGNKLALLKEYQRDPINGDILHSDFFEVSLKEKIIVKVRVVTTGEPLGVKRDGGILQHVMREIEVECLPDNIPGHVEIDISNLEIHHAVHVRDLNIGKDVKVMTDPGEVIVTVNAPAVEKEVAPAAEGVVAAPEVTEPEVIKKGKKEEETEVKDEKKQKEEGK
ncbi:MAG: 50S ribosomal protein L25/general stress protein Ctc [Nitrospiraceae bacterium]|nr:50S ribosomal protein L25/general stress protein Ctc [Nitrospiraceae bacterium]